MLVSKQVLLALSPLHHQVLPPPEVSYLLPSSFVPAVGKALMQQLFDVPVMDGFQHPHCSLQLWHVWWHVGLRVYAAQQQKTAFNAQLQAQLSQQPRPSRPAKPGGNQACQKGRSRNNGKSSSSGSSQGSRDQLNKPGKLGSGSSAAADCQQPAPQWKGLSSSQLEALYMDPEARYVRSRTEVWCE